MLREVLKELSVTFFQEPETYMTVNSCTQLIGLFLNWMLFGVLFVQICKALYVSPS